MVVCTLGDLLLDIVAKLARPLAEGDDTSAETRAGGGGQAANVAAWGAPPGAGGRISVDLSSVNVIREFGAERLSERFVHIRPDVVFGNEAEHAELPVPSETRVVKRGARGATIDGEDHSPLPGEVVDTTGAGDALAAGYLVGGPKLAME